ncbi:MAG: 5'/3'-nucleotidase SurE [Actinomycetota bacterium]
MTWILVTNDDGIDARALVPLVRALTPIAPVRVVVPDGERSWIGKAITRHAPVTVETVDRGGFEMFSCSGSPADCVQLGVHTLFDDPPALVVSGINLGYNHGTAYLHTSGTVGAILEAHLVGVDGLALSTEGEGDFRTWMDWASGAESVPMWERLAVLGADLAAGMIRAGSLGVAISANFPDDADVTTPRRTTTVAETGYDQLFVEDSPGVYVHDYHGGLDYRGPLEGTDIGVNSEGWVTVTPVRAIGTAAFPDALIPLLSPNLP